MSRRALFLDRDGTLVQARHYPSRPEELILHEGVVPELRLLQAAGFRVVLITNQSGLARGIFGPEALDRMHQHLTAELARQGVRLDAIYFCPHHPEGMVAAWAVECACRKPKPGMLLRAAADLDLDLSRSWFIGDILDDIEAGNRAVCRTVLVDLGTEPAPARPVRRPDFVARDTAHALRIVTAVEKLASTAELAYWPPSWQGERWRRDDVRLAATS